MKMKGQTLVEIVVALGVVGVVMLAITVTVTTALSNVQYSKLQNQATQYAQQGMEIIRNMRDTNWANFNTFGTNSPGTNYCLADSCTTLGGAACSTASVCDTTPNIAISGTNVFIRQVKITKNSGNCTIGSATEINVTVKWTDGKCASGAYCHQANINSCLSDYTRRPGL